MTPANADSVLAGNSVLPTIILVSWYAMPPGLAGLGGA